jgi:hypothetical protein
MSAQEAIVERWLERTLKSYPAEMASFLGVEQDRFRNPAGYTLRESLAVLAEELLGTMERGRIASVLDAVVRLRAVQDFSPAEALRFLFELRAAVGEVQGTVSDELQGRIDEMALMAFDQYMACREKIYTLRAKELRFHAQPAWAKEARP